MARMDLKHRLIIAAVALLVVGGTAAMIYSLYVQPNLALRSEQRQLERDAQNLANAPDPAETDFATATAAAAASPERTRAIWEQYLERHPDAPSAADARDGRFWYPIGINLRSPGDATRLLRLDNRGAFLREYPLLSAQLPGLPEGTAAESSVVQTMVNDANGRAITFGQKNYEEGTRLVVLSAPGQSISGASSETPVAQLPPGLVVKNTDLAEIFVLLRRGVPVTIR